jgi:hypothetical protein
VARKPSLWPHQRSSKKKKPAKAAVKVVATVVVNQAAMAAVEAAMAAEASAAKALPAKSALHAKVDAVAKAAQMHAWTVALKDVPRDAPKAVKAKPVPHALSVANGVSARNAVSVPPAKAAVMAVHPCVVRTWLKASVPTAKAKAAPMPRPS